MPFQVPPPEPQAGGKIVDWARSLVAWLRELVEHINHAPALRPQFIWVQSPGGGIPGRTGSTPGSATCTEYRFTSETAFSTTGGSTLTIYNAYPASVGANRLVGAIWWKGRYFVLTESCS